MKDFTDYLVKQYLKALKQSWKIFVAQLLDEAEERAGRELSCKEALDEFWPYGEFTFERDRLATLILGPREDYERFEKISNLAQKKFEKWVRLTRLHKLCYKWLYHNKK